MKRPVLNDSQIGDLTHSLAMLLHGGITGVDVYSRLTEAGSAQFDSRTLCRYLSTRVHQADADHPDQMGRNLGA